MTRKALEEDGYEVVEFDITPEEYKIARSTLIALVINGTVCELVRDFYKNGERMLLGIWVNAFFLGRSRFT